LSDSEKHIETTAFQAIFIFKQFGGFDTTLAKNARVYSTTDLSQRLQQHFRILRPANTNADMVAKPGLVEIAH
jgi:hypothetical protein